MNFSRESVTTVTQIGEQTSKGLDLDVNTDLGRQTDLILNARHLGTIRRGLPCHAVRFA